MTPSSIPELPQPSHCTLFVCLFFFFFLVRFAVEIFFAELCDIYLVRKVISVM